MCSCREDIEEKYLVGYEQLCDNPKVMLTNYGLFPDDDLASIKGYSKLFVYQNNDTFEEKVPFTYCPFCGEKY